MRPLPRHNRMIDPISVRAFGQEVQGRDERGGATDGMGPLHTCSQSGTDSSPLSRRAMNEIMDKCLTEKGGPRAALLRVDTLV